MADILWGFSPKNAAYQIGNLANPTTPRKDYDILTNAGSQRGGGSTLLGGGVQGNSPLTGVIEALADTVNAGWHQDFLSRPEDSSGTRLPGGTGTGTGTGSRLNQAGIDATQRSINELRNLLPGLLEAEAARYRNVRSGFDRQEGQQRGQYDESTTMNQQNYDDNMMAALRAGRGGLRGLMGVLRGAAQGTAGDLARDAVASTTAGDIRQGFVTQRDNQAELDNSLSTFLNTLEERRRQAKDTLENNRRAIRRENLTGLQDLYGKMAGFYGDAGRQAEADNWVRQAAELTPQIARNSVDRVSDYNAAPVQVAAPEIAAFSDPQQLGTSVSGGNTQLGSGIFSVGRRDRERERTLQGV